MAELDEDVEGMQSTIYYLQQQLREAKDTIAKLESQLSDNKVNDDKVSDVRTESTENTDKKVESDQEDEKINNDKPDKHEEKEKEAPSRGKRKRVVPTRGGARKRTRRGASESEDNSDN